ncbi:phage head closure protein [Aquabacterium sp. A7-Y]|uniref:phage head closure protein n=1 Tax=Aquabacterium sp. A7-Y TaxID=1349605 RepID=UPI00223CC8EB|nr:phage head closure protein [Aquabacterium sp. A7-Y]MCW7542012.1 phage head closure protein [Aquabacterium sp. A7-Y]
MTAGELDQRITLQRRGTVKDGYGQEVVAWEDEAAVWAKAEPLQGREFFAAAQAQSEVTVRFTIRYRPGVVPTLRVLWRGQPHGISSVIDVKGKRQWLQLMCSQGVRDGRGE